MATTTRPAVFLLALTVWAVVAVGGAFVLASGYVITGALIVLSSTLLGALVAIAGEVPPA